MEAKKEESKEKEETEKNPDFCMKCREAVFSGTKHECPDYSKEQNAGKTKGVNIGSEKPSAAVSVDLPFVIFFIKLIANFFMLMGFDNKVVQVAEQRSNDIATKFFEENKGKSFAEFTKTVPSKRKVDEMVVH